MSHPLPGPSPTVDVIIDIGGRVVLIERRFEPKGWALPGGVIELGESAPAAASARSKKKRVWCRR